ncbi:glycoside hydrolase [Ascobolus immersus RN42]|uniref:Probable glucan endo-1,3-beta-glucosidase eglC n=1 Tax=Ascobolus immersus RN42 TaxID=1160509 RepID=A0A3N4HRZ2_ASCIM|nr:glycoside hydrolase [Ascobolus immersus RN42]
MLFPSFLSLFLLFASALARTGSPNGVLNPRPNTPSFYSGFNLGSVLPDNTCRTVSQWADEFRRVQSLSTSTNTFNHIKLFTASKCDQASLAAQAALQTGVKVWQGIWIGGGLFQQDLDALARAIQEYGTEWLAGVNVGSEELYRGDLKPEGLAGYILTAKDVLQGQLGADVPIGTADTWNTLVGHGARPVIEASDIIMTNAFPFWEAGSPHEALTLLQTGIQEMAKMIGDTPFVLGETGWPSAGEQVEVRQGVASLGNAERYWHDAACWLTRERVPFYWFEAFDEPNKSWGNYEHPEANFGVATVGGELKFSLEC